MRNPSIWYSEDPIRDRALERAAELHDDWVVANRRRQDAAREPGPGATGRVHGIRLAIGHAAVAFGRVVAGADAVEGSADGSDEWRAAA